MRLVRVITFKLDEETIVRLNKIADELGVTRSEIIRAAIFSYIRRKSEEKVKARKVLLK